MISLISENCTGCGQCEKACLFGGIKIEDKTPVLTDLCTGCGVCIELCKTEAITASGNENRNRNNTEDYKDIWVVAEYSGGKIQNVTKELLGKASEMAEIRDCKVSAVILGNNLNGDADNLINYGADNVYSSDAEFRDRYRTIPYERIISDLVKAHKPEVILFGATPMGRDLAPRLANKFRTGLTADCTDLDITKQGELLQTRPAFGGNIMATISTPNHRPQMATVRPGVMQSRQVNGHRGEKIDIPAEEKKSDDLVEILKIVKKRKSNVDLENSPVIVSGGRGLGKAGNFELLKDLAEAMSGEVGASRGAVELGWMPQTRQIGQTGKTVRPKLYVACGISGAVQHLAGMENSDLIIAINKDPDAPIMKIANYALVGDLNRIVPELIKGINNC